MTPFYIDICTELGWAPDPSLIAQFSAANETQLKELDAKIEDAEKNLGESEVREALLAKAEHFVRIGDRDNAVTAYRITSEKTVAIGQRLDVVFAQIRLGFFFADEDMISRNISKAKSMIEQGGDWDRRNRLKVYEALHELTRRQFAKAAKLFVDSLATFTSTELFSYERLVFYAVVSALVTFDRQNLRKQLIESPEVLTIIHKIPHLTDLLHSFYDCNYAKFMSSLLHIVTSCTQDRYLYRHARWYGREMRVRAYGQYLESYRSVQLSSMASEYGMSVPLLDQELSRFISQGRLNCKIDKVSGVIETNRPDTRNAQYQSMLKSGDVLLNRLQKLSRVINL
jgi:26S proteasome regulatory subunit N7